MDAMHLLFSCIQLNQSNFTSKDHYNIPGWRSPLIIQKAQLKAINLLPRRVLISFAFMS